VQAPRVAGAEEIALLNRCLNAEYIDVRKTATQQHRAGGFLLDPHGHVDLIGRAGHRRILDLDLAEIAGLVDPLFGELQLLAVEKTALELAHLATHHLVAGARVSDNVDPPDIDAPSGIDQEGEADVAFFLVDIELEVARVQVMRSHRFEVGLKFLPGVLVVLRKPGEPSGSAQLEYAEQFLLRKCAIADDVDSPDLRDFPLVQVEIDRDPVAVERRDGRGHLNAIEAPGQILAFELLLGLIEQGTVEAAALLESDVTQPL